MRFKFVSAIFNAAAAKKGPVVELVKHIDSDLLSCAAILGDNLIFCADDGKLGNELWITDGFPSGTRLLKEINPAPRRDPADYFDGGSSPYSCTEYNGNIYFSADDGTHGREPWVTDGTPGGTYLLKDINPGPESSYGGFFGFFVFQGKLFFRADDGVHGSELWFSDGSPAGTVLFKNINQNTDVLRRDSSPSGFTEYKSRFLFSANDGVHGTEPWISDGTAEGTFILKDINPGRRDSLQYDHEFAELDGRVFFQADDFEHGSQLWETDGTAEGTKLFKSMSTDHRVSPYSFGSYPFALHVFDQKLFFVADDGNGREPWVSDGTEQGSVILKQINRIGEYSMSYPSSFYEANAMLYFPADDGSHGMEPWITDGMREGTQMLKDISPGPGNYVGASSYPNGFTHIDEMLFFSAYQNERWKLFVTDGTSEGTQVLKDMAPGRHSSGGVVSFVKFHDELYFDACSNTKARKCALWKISLKKLSLFQQWLRFIRDNYFPS